jgi:hypothetical protein
MMVSRALSVFGLVVVALAASACSGGGATVGGDDGDTGGGSGSGSGSGDGIATSDAEALFDADETDDVTPDSIYGLWGGAMKDMDWTFDNRVRLTETSFTLATRCEDPDGAVGGIAAVQAKARVDDSQIAVLESRRDERVLGKITCRASARPGELTRCTEDDGFQHDCFELDGTSLTLYGATPFDKLAMVKISD